MTEVAEKTTPEPAEGAHAAPEGAAAETPETKAEKSWLERMDNSVKNGATNKRYQYFLDFIKRNSVDEANPDGKYSLDLTTMSIMLSLLNPIRATEEYKAWDTKYRAETVGAGTKAVDLKSKTPDEIKAYQARALKQAEAAKARADRALALLAELESESEAEEAEDATADEVDEVDETDEVTDDQF